MFAAPLEQRAERAGDRCQQYIVHRAAAPVRRFAQRGQVGAGHRQPAARPERASPPAPDSDVRRPGIVQPSRDSDDRH